MLDGPQLEEREITPGAAEAEIPGGVRGSLAGVTGEPVIGPSPVTPPTRRAGRIHASTTGQLSPPDRAGVNRGEPLFWSRGLPAPRPRFTGDSRVSGVPEPKSSGPTPDWMTGSWMGGCRAAERGSA